MKKFFFLWPLFLIFLSTYNYYGKENSDSSFFSIKEIKIQGIKNSSREDLERKFDKIRKKNIIFLRKKNVEKFIKNIDFVNSLRIKKLYPDKIIITVIEDLPIGIYVDDSGKKHILLENNKIIKNHNYELESLPEVYGEGAPEKFSYFYSNLQKTGLSLKLVRQFNYYDINRWDVLLKDKKLVKLPTENYEESITKFLEIHEKSSFKKFKIFDFRIKNEIIMR